MRVVRRSPASANRGAHSFTVAGDSCAGNGDIAANRHANILSDPAANCHSAANCDNAAYTIAYPIAAAAHARADATAYAAAHQSHSQPGHGAARRQPGGDSTTMIGCKL